MAVVVIALRSVPFVLFAGKTKVPAWLLYLGNVLTAAAIAMLVVYCLCSVYKEKSFTKAAEKLYISLIII